MKGIFSIIVFLFVGIVTAFFIGFDLPAPSETIAVDEELKDLQKKYTLKFSHVVARNTPKGKAAAYFAELVKEKTEGWVEVQIYPNGVLYNAQEEFEALKKGEVQMIAPAFSEVSVYDRKWMIMDLPYLFDNEIMVEQALKGKVGDALLQSIENKGYKGIAFWDNGFKQLTNSVRPIVYPEDAEGLSFRVMPSDALIETYKAVGASAVSFPFNEVYHVLHEGIVDGQENTLSNIYSKGFYQQQKFMTISNHNYLGYVILVDPSYWNSLPEKYQTSLIEAMEEVTIWLRGHAQELNIEMYQRISGSGLLEIHEQTDEEKAQWRKVLQPLYDEYELIIGKQLMSEIKKLQIDKEL